MPLKIRLSTLAGLSNFDVANFFPTARQIVPETPLFRQVSVKNSQISGADRMR
jgi:hypothetical protein